MRKIPKSQIGNSPRLRGKQPISKQLLLHSVERDTVANTLEGPANNRELSPITSVTGELKRQNTLKERSIGMCGCHSSPQASWSGGFFFSKGCCRGQYTEPQPKSTPRCWAQDSRVTSQRSQSETPL